MHCYCHAEWECLYINWHLLFLNDLPCNYMYGGSYTGRQHHIVESEFSSVLSVPWQLDYYCMMYVFRCLGLWNRRFKSIVILHAVMAMNNNLVFRMWCGKVCCLIKLPKVMIYDTLIIYDKKTSVCGREYFIFVYP